MSNMKTVVIIASAVALAAALSGCAGWVRRRVEVGPTVTPTEPSVDKVVSSNDLTTFTDDKDYETIVVMVESLLLERGWYSGLNHDGVYTEVVDHIRSTVTDPSVLAVVEIVIDVLRTMMTEENTEFFTPVHQIISQIIYDRRNA